MVVYKLGNWSKTVVFSEVILVLRGFMHMVMFDCSFSTSEKHHKMQCTSKPCKVPSSLCINRWVSCWMNCNNPTGQITKYVVDVTRKTVTFASVSPLTPAGYVVQAPSTLETSAAYSNVVWWLVLVSQQLHLEQMTHILPLQWFYI